MATAAPTAGSYYSGQLIVQFDPWATQAQRQAALDVIGASNASSLSSSHGYNTGHGDDSDGSGHGESSSHAWTDLGHDVVVKIEPTLAVHEAIVRLMTMPGVRLAEPDWEFSITAVSNDPIYTAGNMWGMLGNLTTPANNFGSQAGEVWALNRVGTMKTVVGVIDSGVDYRHPDLYLNIWLNPNEIPTSFRSSLVDTDKDRLITFRDLNSPINASFVRDFNANGYIDGGDLLNDTRWEDRIDGDGNGYIDDLIGWDFANNDNDPFDDNSHGTHVAGTIGAMGGNGSGVTGVNWAIQIVPLKFLDATGSGSSSAAVAALNYYNAQATRNAAIEDFVATNNSWGGGGYSTTLFNAIVNTARAGQLFIAAAGNDATSNDSVASYPANYNTTAAVGFDAVISVASITSTGALSSFSNFGGTTVDIAAPGSSIASTIPGGRYAYLSGTSMAAPHVTGAIALMASANTDLSASQLRALLLNNTAATASLAGRVVTGGRLDLGAIFAAMGTGGSGDTTPPSVTSLTLSDTVLTGGETATVTIDFSENVTNLALGDFTYDTTAGTLSNLVQSVGTPTRWTALFTPAANKTDASNTIGILAGSYTDAAGNPGGSRTSGNFTIDTQAPSATTFQLSTGQVAPGQSATLTIVFSEAVSGLALADLSTNTSAGTLSNLVQGIGNQWTATYTAAVGANATGVTISLGGASYTDTGGNAGLAATTPAFIVAPIVDNTPPTVTSVTVTPASVIAGSTAIVQVTFSEAVSDFTLSDLVYDTSAGTIAGLSQSVTDNRIWTATFTPLSNHVDTTNTVSITAGSYADLASNSGGAGASGNFVVDTVVPVVTQFQLSQSALTNGQTAILTMTFSEAVGGLSLSDFSYNAAAVTLSGLVQIGSTNQWSATVSPRSGVQVTGSTITLVAGSYGDLAGNPGPGAVSSAFSVSTQVLTPTQQKIGTTGSDSLVGTSVAELISGVPLTGTHRGAGTIDTLTGNGGADVFLLGDARGLFYDDGSAASQGAGDYANIRDFQSGDTVRLNGTYGYFIPSVTINRVTGTAIFADTDRNGVFGVSDELVGFLQGVVPSTLRLGFSSIDGTNYAVIS